MAKKSENADNTTPIEVEQGMRLEDVTSPKDQEIEAAEGLNPRKSQLDSIFENRRKQIEKESNFGAEVVKDSAEAENAPEPPPVEGDDITPVAAASSPADDKPTAPVQEPTIETPPANPDEELFTLKVDGVDLKLTKDQLIERAQKGIGAEKKFDEAARLRQEAERLVYGTQPLQPQAPAPQNSAPQGHPVELDDSTVEDFLNKLNFGSKDEQKAAVKNLVSKAASQAPTGTQIPIEQLVNAATQNAVATMQSQQIMADLGKEYPDVFSDNLLSTAAGQLTNQLRDKYTQTGVSKTFLDISREALSTVRDKYIKAPASVPTQPATNSTAVQAPTVVQMDDKVAAKRAAPKPVVAVNKTAPAAPSAPKLNSGAGKTDTVAWLRQKRGQPVYN